MMAPCHDLPQERAHLRWGQGWYNHWGHTVWTLFGQLIPIRLVSKIPVLPSMNLTSVLARPSARRKTVLKVKCFKEASLIGSNGALVSWCKTSERFQEGIPLLPLGLSLWKLSRRRVRFSSLLMLKGEFPSLSAMADL